MVGSQKKILIIGPSWVGDMVMAQTLFSALKQRFPHCKIDVLAPAWSLPILARMPEVNAGIEMTIGHGQFEFSKRVALGKQLKLRGYDQAIVLPNSFKSALIPLFADIPVRTGWRGEMRYGLLNDIRLLIKKRYPLMVQRFVALAYDSTLPFDHKNLQAEQLPRPQLLSNAKNVDHLFQRFGLQQTHSILALCPGAEFGSSKRWPEAYYAHVANVFIRRGWQVALFGSANDMPINQTILQALPATQQTQCLNLAGKTSLDEAVDLLSQASAVVSNDSGLMHICAALNRPMVVVYGSTSPSFTPPLSDNVSIQSVPVECGPCFERECKLNEKQGKLKCLSLLKPEQVISALESLL